MLQKKILEELARNQKNLEIGGEVFNVGYSKDDIKVGKSLKVIIHAMKEASAEKLFRAQENATFS